MLRRHTMHDYQWGALLLYVYAYIAFLAGAGCWGAANDIVQATAVTSGRLPVPPVSADGRGLVTLSLQCAANTNITVSVWNGTYSSGNSSAAVTAAVTADVTTFSCNGTAFIVNLAGAAEYQVDYLGDGFAIEDMRRRQAQDGCMISHSKRDSCWARWNCRPAGACGGQWCDGTGCSTRTLTCNRPDGAPCNDGVTCTASDTCHSGRCAPGTHTSCPLPCTECDGHGGCRPRSGFCLADGPNGAPMCFNENDPHPSMACRECSAASTFVTSHDGDACWHGISCHPECVNGCVGTRASDCNQCRHFASGATCVTGCVATAEYARAVFPSVIPLQRFGAAPQCIPLTQCTPSQFESVSPTSVSDRQCDRVRDPCGEGEYEMLAPGDYNDRQCMPCTACPEGHRELQPCNATADRVCARCTVCGPHEHIFRACTASVDTICEACRVCSDAEFETGPCGGFANRHCHATTVCDPDYEEETARRTATTDRICGLKNCSHAAIGRRCYDECPANYWLSGDLQCIPIRGCAVHQHETVPPTRTSDRQCQNNRMTCEPWQWMLSPPGPSQDMQCRNCSTCAAGTFQLARCTHANDTVCEHCTPCPHGQYEHRPCSQGHDSECAEHTACNNGEIEHRGPTPTSDRRCVASPTMNPTVAPTIIPTVAPTASPTSLPTQSPTIFPTVAPTVSPTRGPTISPTASPNQIVNDFRVDDDANKTSAVAWAVAVSVLVIVAIAVVVYSVYTHNQRRVNGGVNGVNAFESNGGFVVAQAGDADAVNDGTNGYMVVHPVGP